jgi:hypothetical protein
MITASDTAGPAVGPDTDPVLSARGLVIPEGEGLCQHVSDHWFCWLWASVRAASGKDRGQDGAPAAQRGRTVLTVGRPDARCGRMPEGQRRMMWLWAFSKP